MAMHPLPIFAAFAAAVLFLATAPLASADTSRVLAADDLTATETSASLSWIFGTDKGDGIARSGRYPQGLVLRTGGRVQNGNLTATAYFTPADQPVELEQDQSLVLRFEMTVDESAQREQGLRLGLFHSGGSRPQNPSYETALHAKWTGYSAWLRVGPPERRASREPGIMLHRRSAEHPILLSTPANPVLPTSQSLPNTFLQIGPHPDNELVITRRADGLHITGRIAGMVVTGHDPSPVTTRFDSISFFLSGTAFYGGGLTLRNLSVTLTGATSAQGPYALR